MITQARLQELLHYDAECGVFTRKQALGSRAPVGAIVGTGNGNGYLRTRINGRSYFIHRLAWLYMYGVWPTEEIDHINGIRSDNRIANLRLATRRQNGANLPKKKNNTSGHPGVSWARREKRWEAYINPNGKRKGLGYFCNKNDAIAARRHAEQEYFGEFTSGRL